MDDVICDFPSRYSSASFCACSIPSASSSGLSLRVFGRIKLAGLQTRPFQFKTVDTSTRQSTLAVNRRIYERWRDIDLPKSGTKDKRHALVRRCASFWVSETPGRDREGWDAVILVDPGMASTKVGTDMDTTVILKDSTDYKNRKELWAGLGPSVEHKLQMVPHKSDAYHGGCTTLAQMLFPKISDEAEEQTKCMEKKRDLVSPLDEQVFYWTNVASSDLINSTALHPSDAAFFLAKHVAQHWTNLLELLNCTIVKGEYLSDDFQATMDDRVSQQQWKRDLNRVSKVVKDINYMRRQLQHYWRAMVLNLERLGVQIGAEAVDEKLPSALCGAQKDFLTLSSRMQPLLERGDALAAIANDLSNLRTAFRGIHDGEFSLRLSLFASVVFPLTLVASIFSMNDSYLPGSASFWKFWTISLPFVATFAVVLVYGKRPYRIVGDLKESVKPSLDEWGFGTGQKRERQIGARDAKVKGLRGSDQTNQGFSVEGEVV